MAVMEIMKYLKTVMKMNVKKNMTRKHVYENMNT